MTSCSDCSKGDCSCHNYRGSRCCDIYTYPGESLNGSQYGLQDDQVYGENGVNCNNFNIIHGTPERVTDALYGYVNGNRNADGLKCTDGSCADGYECWGLCGNPTLKGNRDSCDGWRIDKKTIHNVACSNSICVRKWSELQKNMDDCCAGNKKFINGECRPKHCPPSQECLDKMATYIDTKADSPNLWTNDIVNDYLQNPNVSDQMIKNKRLLVSQLLKEKGGYGIASLKNNKQALQNLKIMCETNPGLCDIALDEYCSTETRESIAEKNTSDKDEDKLIANLCACHLPTTEYLGYKQVLAGESPQCDPICVSADNIKRGNFDSATKKWVPDACNQTVCIIDGYNIQMNTGADNQIQFSQMCQNNSDCANSPTGKCCVFSIADLTEEELTLLGKTDLESNCSKKCYILQKDRETGQQKEVKVDCGKVVQELQNQKNRGGGDVPPPKKFTVFQWMWVVAIAMLVLFLLFSIFYNR